MSLLKVIMQAIREWRLPMFGLSRNGVALSRCPRCRAPITLTKVVAGEPAFRCASCGEEAMWKAPS